MAAAGKLERDVERQLANGSVRLLRAKWLLDESELSCIQRRQHLPPEAFVPLHEAVAMYQSGLVYVFSYGWLTQSHSDPHGLYLRALRRFFEGLVTCGDPGI